jgi:hypothetical protein
MQIPYQLHLAQFTGILVNFGYILLKYHLLGVENLTGVFIF